MILWLWDAPGPAGAAQGVTDDEATARGAVERACAAVRRVVLP